MKAILWALRAGIAAMAIGGGLVAYQRLHRTDEQVELTRYVELEVPALSAQEDEILRRLAPLSGAGPALGPEAARKLLVDDVIPRLVHLRKQAAAVVATTTPVRALRDEYLGWIDLLTAACRASVRAIDDDNADPAHALGEIRRRFADADAASRRWSEHVRALCLAHHLAK